MRKETIRDHIDKKILKDLESMSPDEVRFDLNSVSKRFEGRIEFRPQKFDEIEIEKILDVRSKYLSYYVYFSQKRIIDLYKVERKDIYGWPHTKKFKAILFKEKIEANAIPF